MVRHDKFIEFTPDGKFIVAKIHPEAAGLMAQVFQNIAEELNRTALQKKKHDLEKVARIQHHRHIDVMVAMMIEDGKTREQAVVELSKYGVAAHHVEYLWNFIRPRVKRFKRKARQTTAKRMRRAGFSNKEIAKSLNCCTRTVIRMLK